jgi:thymidylate synthase (FAD)
LKHKSTIIIGRKYKMKARLISYSKPSRDIASEGLYDMQELIAFCARVSNPANQLNTETSAKLINYLVKNKHWSPLEMVSACVEVETTRDIARQILRHRSFSFQEFSQRYADPTKDLDFVFREARLQDLKNRQNSIETDDLALNAKWIAMQNDVIEAAKKAYTWAVENGIAKEQARAVLPEGNTVSRMYINGTLRSFIHYIEVRSEKATQKEHREIAIEIAKVIAEVFPLAHEFVSK